MTRSCFLLVLLLVVLLAWHPRTALSDAPKNEAVTEKEIHAEAQAWQYSGVDLAKDHVATITAKGEWKINPLWKQAFGAGGKPKSPAGLSYLKSGANHGCLLLRTGDEIVAFSKDDDTLVIKTPGKIYFCANEEPNEDGVARFKEQMEGKRAKDYAGALAIPAPKEASTGCGFLDNTGSLRVRLVVTKVEK